MMRPTRSGPAARARIVCASGMMSPPPSPCTTRNAIRLPEDQASPQSTEPVMNSTRATIHSGFAP
jgi:hypothetical protein